MDKAETRMNTATLRRQEERSSSEVDGVFMCGFAAAVAALARSFDQPGMAAGIISGYGLTKQDFAKVDAFDRREIYKLFRTESILKVRKR